MTKKLKVQDHYSLHIHWSPEDRCYVARVPELPGCEAVGATYIEAAVGAERAISSYLIHLGKLGQKRPRARR
jgi:predicted RNase H-like HicB family nuclease